MTKLGKPINIRISLENQLFYEAEAKSKNMPFRTLLRRKLEERYRGSDEINEEIKALRKILEQNIQNLNSNLHYDSNSDTRTSFGTDVINVVTGNPTNEAKLVRGMLIEMLLIMCQIGQPERARMAQAEVERLGLEVWRGKI